MERIAHFKGWIVHLDVAGGWTIPLEILCKIPALCLIKDGEKQREFLDGQLSSMHSAQYSRLANNQRPDKTRVQVFLLERESQDQSEGVLLFLCPLCKLICTVASFVQYIL